MAAGSDYRFSRAVSFRSNFWIRALQRVQPRNPHQNAYIECCNRTVRYDWLAQRLFDSIEHVQLSATRWLWTYNHERPNMAIGGITPMQKFAMAA